MARVAFVLAAALLACAASVSESALFESKVSKQCRAELTYLTNKTAMASLCASPCTEMVKIISLASENHTIMHDVCARTVLKRT